MDSCNFDVLKEPQFSENDDIKRIKQMLISGNKEQIISAASEILSGMEDNKRMVDMIKSDVCDFLCNAMVPLESNISGTIYNCLAIMAKYQYFYSHGHASVAIETVTRSMHFLIKSGSHDFSLRQPLKLLELIVEGCQEFHVQPEKKPLKNLMALIFSLLKETVPQRVKYQIGVIIREMFNLEFLINPKLLISISEKWIDASFFKNNEPFTLPKDFINLGCAISKQALSCLIDNNLIGLECDLETESESNIAKTITIFLLEYVSSYIVVKGDDVEKEGFERLEHYFMCLSFLLKDLFEQQQLIIHTLSEMGFIQLIYSILSDKYFNRCENLCKLCLTVLLEMLLALSDDVFSFNRMWPDGRDNFRNEITKGMYLLPVDASLWRDSITDVTLNRSGKLVLILFFYFHFLTIRSSSNEIVVTHPPVINLVNTMLEKTSSLLQIKAVWFICVMSQMSETSIRDSSAVEKMLDILEAQTELTLLYTHHPAMLYWTFSTPGISYRFQREMYHCHNNSFEKLSRMKHKITSLTQGTRGKKNGRLGPLMTMDNDVLKAKTEAIHEVRFGTIRKTPNIFVHLSSTIQEQVQEIGHREERYIDEKLFKCSVQKFDDTVKIKLWLENSSGDSSVLNDLVEKSEDVRLRLFELLQKGDEHTTRMAFSTLKTFLVSSEDDSHSSSVWFLLLQTLAKYTTDSSNAVEVDYILELATLIAPQQEHLSESVLIASLLPEALKKTDLISLTSAMKLVLQLLEMSLKCDHSRVLSAFLRSGAFIQRVLSALETNVDELLLYSLKITAVIWNKPPSSMPLLPDYDGIMLDSSVLLNIINSKDMDIINTGLVLIEQMLRDRFKSYLIRVQVSSCFMKILFFGLENALMMHLPLISGRAWTCLKHCIKDNNSLAEDVLLNEVIKYGLEHMEETPEIVDFLLLWMERRRETEKFYPGYRRIKQSYFLETIYYIGAFVAESRTENAGRLYDGVVEWCRHFSIDTSIEPFNRIISAPSDLQN